MPIPLNRVIIFVGDVQKCARFYSAVFGWTFADYGPTYASFDDGKIGGGFTTDGAPHPGGPTNPHKIVFYAEDVEATRAAIVARGAVMGEVRKFGPLELCDGEDPEGHAFQISNRS